MGIAMGFILIIYSLWTEEYRPLQVVYQILVLLTLKRACGRADFVTYLIIVSYKL